MKYKIVKGLKSIREIFKAIRESDLVTNSYFGKTVLNICNTNDGINAIVYEPEKKELTTVGDENHGLLKKFNEMIDQRKIELKNI